MLLVMCGFMTIIAHETSVRAHRTFETLVELATTANVADDIGLLHRAADTGGVYLALTTGTGLESYSNAVDGGWLTVEKFGYNPVVSASAREDIWSLGLTYTGYLSAALPVRVQAGGNAADTAAGAGARGVKIIGLDSDFDIIEETVATAGASASALTVQPFIRVYRVQASGVGGVYGTPGANTGAITIESSGADVMAHIGATLGQTEQTHYCVPAGYRAHLRHASTSVGEREASVELYQRAALPIVAPFASKRIVHRWPANLLSAEEYWERGAIIFDEKTDLWGEAVGSSGAPSAVELSYTLELEPWVYI